MNAREIKDQASEHFRKGKFAKAAESYLSLIKLEPQELQHYVKLGDSYRREGAKDRAIEAYREAVDGYARQGVMIKAIATCKLILEIDPAHKHAQEALAQLCAQRYARPSEAAAKQKQPIPTPERHGSRDRHPESIELPEEDGSDTLELDDGRPLGEKPAAPERGLPSIRPSTAPPPKPPPAPPPVMRQGAPSVPPPRPPAPQPLPARRQVEAIELVDDSDEVSIELSPIEASMDPEKREESGIDLDLSIDIEVSAGPAKPAPVKAAPARSAPAKSLPEATAPTEAIIEVFVDTESMPPGPSMVTPDTAREHEILRSAARAAAQPTTEMANILSATTDDAEDEDPIAASILGTQPRRPISPPAAPETGASALEELYRTTAPAPRRSSPEAQQAAQLAEEAAFEIPAPMVETTLPLEPTLAIPSADLNQEDVPLFSQLPKDAFIDLLEQLTFRRVSAGDVILREGDVGKSIYVLASGQARVVKGLGEGAGIELAQLPEGAFFGEMALLNGAPRVASVVATADSEILELPEAILRNLTIKHPSVGESLKKFYRQRLLANVMAISPLFKSFDKNDRRALVEKFKLREVQKGEPVIKEGQPTDGLYVVMHGAALVTKRSGQGDRVVALAVLKEGDVFGEMSLLTRKPTSATVTAKRKTLMLRLPKQSFDELMFTHPAVLEVVSELSEQRTKVNEQILSGAIDAPRETMAFL